ncbi:MAG: RluA family pseudouridine synthase [Flavobacteriaceae bacterium]|nr:RluA family pseudouridine synthase [Flavobacteriaceae bacterium]
MKGIEVLYEDNHIIAVNKKAGDLVQGDQTGDETLADKVKAYIKKKYDKEGDVFLGIPHRIDRPVSGVVVYARTSKALTRLNKMFQQKGEEIEKIYWAIVENTPREDEEQLRNFIRRNPKQNKSYVAKTEKDGAKLAILDYRLLACSQKYFLLEVTLHTGRHHQIRCQLSGIGCPIRGDLKYGAKRSVEGGGIGLHARKLAFIHPVKKERIEIIAPVPKENLWQELEKAVD